MMNANFGQLLLVEMRGPDLLGPREAGEGE